MFNHLSPGFCYLPPCGVDNSEKINLMASDSQPFPDQNDRKLAKLSVSCI